MDDPYLRTDDASTDRGYSAQAGRVGPRGSTAPWMALIVGALLLAVIKPWGPDAGHSSPSGSAGDGSPSGAHMGTPAVAGADPTANAGLRSVCHNTDAWLLATVEASRGQTLRVLRVVAPVRAGRPADPALPRVVFGSESVAELGWCAPVVGPDRSAGIATVTAWAVANGHARQIALDGDHSFDGSGFGALYRPTPGGSPGGRAAPSAGAGPAPSTWPSGIYVLTLVDADGTSRSFGVDLEILPRGWPSGPPPSGRPTAPH